MQTKIINLYGGPGTGKSTLAARVYAELRTRGCGAELVTEYAKELVWLGRIAEMEDQLSIFAQQHRRILRVYHQVEYIVTDAPLLNSLIYQPKGYPPEFEAMVIAFVRRLPNQKNFILRRRHPYEQNGRLQGELDATVLDGIVEERIGALLGTNHNRHLRIISADQDPLTAIMMEIDQPS